LVTTYNIEYVHLKNNQSKDMKRKIINLCFLSGFLSWAAVIPARAAELQIPMLVIDTPTNWLVIILRILILVGLGYFFYSAFMTGFDPTGRRKLRNKSTTSNASEYTQQRGVKKVKGSTGTTHKRTTPAETKMGSASHKPGHGLGIGLAAGAAGLAAGAALNDVDDSDDGGGDYDDSFFDSGDSSSDYSSDSSSDYSSSDYSSDSSSDDY
jgi:hypothetical protein